MLSCQAVFAALAFPGAEGFGANARGRRGGDVYTVTNTNESAPGSLRQGISSANRPRTIVFAVSGLIELQSKLKVDKDYITIAGQTAPADVGGWPEYHSTPAPTDSDLDGMPDAWETSHGLNPGMASDRNNHDLDPHYTNLEVYLHGIVTPPALGAETRAVADRDAFVEADLNPWKKVFSDPCTGDWSRQWFLDGEVGSVKTGPLGMELTAGPEYKNDAHHMVLWTKEHFEGDLKIEFDYTRLDSETRCVNILYIQATGSGEKPYVKDIAKWNDLRRIPAMRMYFDHMNTYHISYAAFPNDEDTTSYIRARRYMPNETGLQGSDLKPDYFPEGLFGPGVPHKITVIKKERDLFMRVENPEQTLYCHMTNPDLPGVTEGRIGLRHMFTRSARYKNISISVPE